MAIASLRQHRARWSQTTTRQHLSNEGLPPSYPLPFAVRGSSARSAFTRFFNPNRSNPAATVSCPPCTVHPSLPLHAFFHPKRKNPSLR